MLRRFGLLCLGLWVWLGAVGSVWGDEMMAPTAELAPFVLPEGCRRAPLPAKLCGGGSPCTTLGTSVVTTGIPQGPTTVVSGPDGPLVRADKVIFYPEDDAWHHAPLPEREGVLLETATDPWFGRSTSPNPTVRRWSDQSWGPTLPKAGEGGRWRYVEAGCPLAVERVEARVGDHLLTRVAVRAWDGGKWTQPWRVTLGGSGFIWLFADPAGRLHLFFNQPTAKGHFLWWGHSGMGHMRRVMNPVDPQRGPLQTYHVNFAHTQDSPFAFITSSAGIHRVHLDGKPPQLYVKSANTTETEGAKTRHTEVTAQIVGLVASASDVRLVYRVDQRIEVSEQFGDGGSRGGGNRQGGPYGRPSRVETTVLDSSRRHAITAGDVRGPSHPLNIKGWASDVTLDRSGRILLVDNVAGERSRATVALHALGLAGANPWDSPRVPVRVQHTRRSSLNLEASSAEEMFEAGFQRWGLGQTDFEGSGALNVRSDSYEEWMSAEPMGLLRGHAGDWSAAFEVQVMEPARKGGDGSAHLNAGVWLVGLRHRVKVQFVPGMLVVKFNSQYHRVEVDLTQRRALELVVRREALVVKMDGEEIARMKVRQPLREVAPTDQLYVTLGALGGTSGAHVRLSDLVIEPLTD